MYYTLNGYIDGVKVAELDLDDTSSYGPETVTLTVDASVLSNGSFFRYSVHDYTNGGSYGLSSKALSSLRLQTAGTFTTQSASAVE